MASAPKPGAAPARRVSRNILDDLDESAPGAGPETQRKELTSELAQQIFERFRDKLRETNQSVLVAQTGDMKVELPSPDEVRIICPNEMSEEYAKMQRDILISFFCAEAGQTVRVTTETRIDPNAAPTSAPVLSKQELYELLSREYPALAKLKEGLNLQIDY